MPGDRRVPIGGAQSSRAQRTLDLIDRLARLARTGRQRSDLIPAQREALSYLARANRFSRTPGALALYLGATKGTVSQTVIALERRGYLTKTVSPADARSVRLDLTDQGREALFEIPVESLACALHSLPAARGVEVDQALTDLLSSMIVKTGSRAFGQCKTCRHFEPDGRDPAVGPYRCRLLSEPLSVADAELICAEQQGV